MIENSVLIRLDTLPRSEPAGCFPFANFKTWMDVDAGFQYKRYTTEDVTCSNEKRNLLLADVTPTEFGVCKEDPQGFSYTVELENGVAETKQVVLNFQEIVTAV